LKLRWSLRSQDDLDRIWHFLADRSVEWADRTEAGIFAGVERLIDFPGLGRPRSDGGRELSLPAIQYVVAYTVQDDDILITAVRSTREDL
jgi:plasmid stabilization system protein ParE